MDSLPLKQDDSFSTQDTKEMTRNESAFVCGLIKKYRPRKILEVGVAAGGTTAIILKTISILGLDADLYSVDASKKYYADKSLDTGHMAMPYATDRWHLFTGDVISAYLEMIGPGIDMCILDTMHILPGELIDFLCVLPYLQTGSVVILHDVNLHNSGKSFSNSIATRVLLSCVRGERIEFEDEEEDYGIANIAAFRVTPDTYRHIGNVFETLLLRWSYLPAVSQLKSYYSWISAHYPDNLSRLFARAVNVNFKNFGKLPPFENNLVSVCYAADRKYLAPLLVSLTSLLLNFPPDKELEIFILEPDFREEDQQALHSLEKLHEKLKIIFIKIDNQAFSDFSAHGHVDSPTYYRLLIPKLIPAEREKVLYIDCDTVIDGDISVIYDVEIEKSALGAVEDIVNRKVIEQSRNKYLLSSQFYFNAGILLLNLKRLRQMDLMKLGLETVAQYGQPVWWDQDILNAIIPEKDIFKFPFQFNMHFWASETNSLVNPESYQRTLGKILKNIIIHYITDKKPWHVTTLKLARNRHVKLWYHYRRLAPVEMDIPRFPLGLAYNSRVLVTGGDLKRVKLVSDKIRDIQDDVQIEMLPGSGNMIGILLKAQSACTHVFICGEVKGELLEEIRKMNLSCNVYLVKPDNESLIALRKPETGKLFYPKNNESIPIPHVIPWDEKRLKLPVRQPQQAMMPRKEWLVKADKLVTRTLPAGSIRRKAARSCARAGWRALKFCGRLFGKRG